MLNLHLVLLPRRIPYQRAGKALAKETRIEVVPDGTHKVTVVGRDLVFYWPAAISNNLHYTIDQEFNPGNPHHYTTPPIELTSQSLVLDVGACEGLFAFRAVRQKLAARVICFEPSPRNVRYARLAAQQNRAAEQVTIERLAVGKSAGRFRFVEDDTAPDGHSVVQGEGQPEASMVDCVTLDEYCASKGIRLGRRDLIKIDAEGSDLDVLLGAERLIRNDAPQIAVTTYHKPEHASLIVDFLKSIQPAYRLRLKGFSSWNPVPTPVLLQAALPREQTDG
ncbi:MAG TPA: FkbM family methyltransferase [Verrucomicrobiae bacterium]